MLEYCGQGSGGPGLFVKHFSGTATRLLPDLNRSPLSVFLAFAPFGLSCPGSPCSRSVNLGPSGSRFGVISPFLAQLRDCATSLPPLRGVTLTVQTVS